MSTRPAALLAVAGAAAVLASCGDKESTQAPAALTDAQASLMAGALDENRRAGGARFRVTSLDAPGGSTITLDGQVDWRRRSGHATVSARSGANGVTEVGWGPKVVVEQRPGLADEIARVRPGAVLVARPPDQQRRRLDQLIAVVGSLATRRRENPLLIRQEPGSAFLRSDTLRGRRVEVLRYGKRTTLWIDPSTRRLVRLESRGTGGTPVIIDILSSGPQEIPGPNPRLVVAASQLRPSYSSLAPASP